MKVWMAIKLTVLVVAIASGGLTLWKALQSSHLQDIPPAQATDKSIRAVTAIGRLEPEGEVIHLSASPSTGSGRVETLLVKEGDTVPAGAVVAVLDSHERAKAAVVVAQQQVAAAKANLAQVKSGAKSGDLAAQKAVIMKLESELAYAERECKRYQGLFEQGAISESLFDARRLQVDTLCGQLNQARACLDSLSEVRSVDVARAQAEVESTLSQVKKAQEDVRLTYVKAPKSGQVLKIYAHPGEVIKSEGILDLGQTRQMYAVAEVYETDIGLIRTGQAATIFSDALRKSLRGTVERIGLQIGKRNVLDPDPAADVDCRVVEVRIRLNAQDSIKVTALTNLRVKVAISV